MKSAYDVLVIGAGIFGCYTALFYARKGKQVLLVDREERPWSKASLVNQARVHTGYHYPRSIKTARVSLDNRRRFIREHGFAINDTFLSYYAIDKYGSLTSSDQFARFCQKLDIPHRETSRPDLFKPDRIEALFETEEFSFDPALLRRHYLAQLADAGVELVTGSAPKVATASGGQWEVELGVRGGDAATVETPFVINATYSNINAVNRLFGATEIGATHEISEIALVSAAGMENVGITVMDGPYISMMPFGLSGYSSLSSVLYTHRTFSAANDPTFSCQERRSDCTPERTRACLDCSVRPSSNARKMISQARNYLADNVDVQLRGSLHTVKTKLQSAYRDDGRPTDIRILSTEPFFACIFSGKINSIYEIETTSNYA